MKEKFYEIYSKMKRSSDVEDMRTFGHAAKMMFDKMTIMNPGMAKEWLDMLEQLPHPRPG